MTVRDERARVLHDAIAEYAANTEAERFESIGLPGKDTEEAYSIGVNDGISIVISTIATHCDLPTLKALIMQIGDLK